MNVFDLQSFVCLCLYDDHFVNIDNNCVANDIIDLCRQRDNYFHWLLADK